MERRSEKLRTYLSQDRQWKREHRIAHARYQLGLASDDSSRDFWKGVLRANGASLKGVK